jgi:hypothetical protein
VEILAEEKINDTLAEKSEEFCNVISQRSNYINVVVEKTQMLGYRFKG